MIDNRSVWPSMNGPKVFRWATSKMPEVAEQVLERNGVTIDDIALLVPHQANRRINEFVAQKLNIPPEKVVHNIEKYGNTTAASIPLALSEAIGEGRVKPGDLVPSLQAFGGASPGAQDSSASERRELPRSRVRRSIETASRSSSTATPRT